MLQRQPPPPASASPVPCIWQVSLQLRTDDARVRATLAAEVHEVVHALFAGRLAVLSHGHSPSPFSLLQRLDVVTPRPPPQPAAQQHKQGQEEEEALGGGGVAKAAMLRSGASGGSLASASSALAVLYAPPPFFPLAALTAAQQQECAEDAEYLAMESGEEEY